MVTPNGDELLSITVETCNDLSTVLLRGEMDSATATRVERVVCEAWTRGATGPVLLDLAEVSFIDSGALGTLVSCHRSATAAQAQLLIYGLRPFAARVLAITGLEDYLRVYETRDDALTALM